MIRNSLLSNRRGLNCALGALFLVGCSKSDRTEVYPVSGTVLYDGKPMEGGGSIAFVPTGKGTGKAPGGIIDAQGNYTLGTYAESDGSMPGEFRVVVTQVTVNEPTPSPDGSAPIKAAPGLPKERHIPAVYSDFRASPATAKVEAKTNQIDIEIHKQ